MRRSGRLGEGSGTRGDRSLCKCAVLAGCSRASWSDVLLLREKRKWEFSPSCFSVKRERGFLRGGASRTETKDDNVAADYDGLAIAEGVRISISRLRNGRSRLTAARRRFFYFKKSLSGHEVREQVRYRYVQAEREELRNAAEDHYHGGRKVDDTAVRRRKILATFQLPISML